ncbi:MAG: NAD(P)-dependent dehydrogenase (short-subunit alcohol dehydrogenase family) [Rhodothermales bacterium]|jgi:NAD(P)-dependent dehydrogenase (short-subunit alcohol dehydrogenase family)
MGFVVITGANRGIGLALCQLYRRRGKSVIAACRQSSPELEQTGADVVSGVEITTADGREHLRSELGDRRIDLLIHNAGVWCDDWLGELNEAQLQEAIQVNALAPLLLTEALLPHLDAGSKIGLITSRMGSIADNSSGGRYGYRMAKAALNAAGKSLSIDLRQNGIAVAILHPGFVKTRMVGFSGNITPAESARGLSQRLEELSLDSSGTFWHADGTPLPW